MDNLVRKIRVFVASPGDVAPERNLIPKVVQEINLIISVIAPEKKVLLDLIRWETHVHPALGRDAQDVVNQQIPDYEIFIGIMWKRFGTPTSTAGSGTQEEFNKAYDKWTKNNRFPVLFYFSQKNIAIPGTVDDAEQLKKVVTFKDTLVNKGLIWEYNGPDEFADIIRPHLVMTLSKLLDENDEPTSRRETMKPTDSDLSIAASKVNELRYEYEHLRETMSVGNERTGKMSVVESKMRAMSFQIRPLLPHLINSNSAGERLAAVATLKEIPDVDYVDWLANRVGKAESSFLGYHATIALLNAARVYRKTDHKSEVKKAIDIAIQNLDKSGYKDPNQVKVLAEASKEIK